MEASNNNNVDIRFLVNRDKEKPQVGRLHLYISTPDWDRRVDYSCMIPHRRATAADKMHLLEAFINKYAIPGSAVESKCRELLQELTDNQEL